MVDKKRKIKITFARVTGVDTVSISKIISQYTSVQSQVSTFKKKFKKNFNRLEHLVEQTNLYFSLLIFKHFSLNIFCVLMQVDVQERSLFFHLTLLRWLSGGRKRNNLNVYEFDSYIEILMLYHSLIKTNGEMFDLKFFLTLKNVQKIKIKKIIYFHFFALIWLSGYIK